MHIVTWNRYMFILQIFYILLFYLYNLYYKYIFGNPYAH